MGSDIQQNRIRRLQHRKSTRKDMYIVEGSFLPIERSDQRLHAALSITA